MLFNTKVTSTDYTPADLAAIIKELKKTKSKNDCLKRAYEILSQKYRGQKFHTYLFLHRLAVRDIKKLWAQSGFMHCTNINYVLKFLLLESGFFKDSDIKFCWTQMYYFSPHQYLKVRIDTKKYINIDIWAKVYGVPFGQYAKGWRY